jgi:peptide/nickel transport system substrate-binding protein
VPLLGCDRGEGNRCFAGGSVLTGSFWTEPGLEQALQRSSTIDGPARVSLLRTIQRRTAAASPYVPIWLVAPVAWSRPHVSRPRFDGSGRVVLSELQGSPPGGRRPQATGLGGRP